MKQSDNPIQPTVIFVVVQCHIIVGNPKLMTFDSCSLTTSWSAVKEILPSLNKKLSIFTNQNHRLILLIAFFGVRTIHTNGICHNLRGIPFLI
jgi:hypothetical protein